jgi:hypothetical protein
MLTLIAMLGAATAIAAAGSFLLYWDHQATRRRLDRAVRGLDHARLQRDEACDRVELLRGQVGELRRRGIPDLLRCQQEASRLRGELQDKERELEEARQGGQRSEARLRDLEEALEQVQGQCQRERARAKDLAEREQALAERNSRLDAEAQKSAALLGAARAAGADLARRHDELARRHQALVGAVEECRRAQGTPGWYAASWKLVWQAAEGDGDAAALRLPPLPDYLGQCIRHWQELHREGRDAESIPAVPPPGRARNGVGGQVVAS